jgi:hypothetical protein
MLRVKKILTTTFFNILCQLNPKLYSCTSIICNHFWINSYFILQLFEWTPKPKVTNIVDTTKGSIVHEETQLVASIGLVSLIDPLAIVGKTDYPFASFYAKGPSSNKAWRTMSFHGYLQWEFKISTLDDSRVVNV